MAVLSDQNSFDGFIHGVFPEQGQIRIPLKASQNAPAEYPLHMKQLRTQHISLFRILRDQCLFLTRRQIERVLTLPTNSTNKELLWLLSEGYLARRYRADTFSHYQAPLYYLGKLGWNVVGNPTADYKGYRLHIEQQSERQMEHTLATYGVLLKFLLESEVKQIIGSEDGFWQEAIDFGNIPDAWIQFNNDEVFIEVDRHTEWGASLKRKFDNYVRFKASGAYGNRFPGCNFRVLVITTTEARVEFMQHLAASDDIWFCAMDVFLREKLTDRHWFSLNGFYALSPSPKEEVPELR